MVVMESGYSLSSCGAFVTDRLVLGWVPEDSALPKH